MARSTRRYLSRPAKEHAVERDDPPLAQLRSRYLRHQGRRGHSPCTLKNCRQTLDSLARFGADHGLALSASSFPADLLRDYHARLKQTPLLCVNGGGRQRFAGGFTSRMRLLGPSSASSARRGCSERHRGSGCREFPNAPSGSSPTLKLTPSAPAAI